MDLINFFHGAFENKGDFTEVIDLLFFNKLMDADSKKNGHAEGYFITELGVEFLRRPQDFVLEDGRLARLKAIQVDSTDWTGLAKAVTPQKLQTIKEHSKALQVAIMQSDADIETKADACKRVEAVITLLEAPNVPWREVVSLLNHPSVTALLAAINLIQLIIGMGN